VSAENANKVNEVLLDAVADVVERELKSMAELLSVLPRERIKAMLTDTKAEGVRSLVNVTPAAAEAETPKKGRTTPNKLTPEMKKQIRRLRASDPETWTLAKLGEKFGGVTPTTIRNALGLIKPKAEQLHAPAAKKKAG